MGGGIAISEDLLNEMVLHAREALPNEACGILSGVGQRVFRVYRLNSSNPSPVSYVVDARDHMEVMNDIASSGERMLAIYHSHPESPPVPSLTDIKRSFFPGTRDPNYPDVVHVIIGLAGSAPEVKAYRIEARGISNVEIDHGQG